VGVTRQKTEDFVEAECRMGGAGKVHRCFAALSMTSKFGDWSFAQLELVVVRAECMDASLRSA